MANEQRCIDLGANCIASEPLNTGTYTYINPWCNAGDTSGGDKQMRIDSSGAAGQFIENSSGADMSDWSFPTSGVMFAAMPNMSPSVTRFLQGSPEPSDVNFLGHQFGAGDPTARRSMRWYQYFSSTWEDSNGSNPGCLNGGKIFELGPSSNPVVFTSNGNHQMYGWAVSGWNISPFDCCTTGPGSAAFSMSEGTVRGKWWRFEVVVRNALSTGSVTKIELWRTNVTDGGATIKVLDTADFTVGSGTGGDNWSNTQATTLKPSARLDQFNVVGWRNGTCAGYVGYSHLMAAAWSTDAGQMIGAASELEGGGGGGGSGATGLRPASCF